MAKEVIRLGVLTSSRADYGIYQPLLKRLSNDKRFDLRIIVFGTHLSKKFGYTISEIEQDNFGSIMEVSGMPDADSLVDICLGYAELVKRFAQFWSSQSFDWVIALGDRFEMSAAVQASIPFEIKISHLHGGETTLGATDNIYRHQISLASKLHFVSTKEFKRRVGKLLDMDKHIYNVGALSLDDLDELDLPAWSSVCKKFNIPNISFVLVTFHPETIGAQKNDLFANEVYKTLEFLAKDIHIVVTMTNADAMGSFYRNRVKELKTIYPSRFSLIENFGRINYYAAMKNCTFLMGNTSSGIIEAASFNKYVVNVGDRQKGRLRNDNVVDVPFNWKVITKSSLEVQRLGKFEGTNRFQQPNTAINIIEVLANAQL